MNIACAGPADFAAWLNLAREVEHLFGPMAGEAEFHAALRREIAQKHAFCIRSSPAGQKRALKGGIVIAPDANEISWLAVTGGCRGQGCGRELLLFALGRLDNRSAIFVQTFAASVPEGGPARKLYGSCGFVEKITSGLNPAGVPTVIMERAGTRAGSRQHNPKGGRK